MLGNLLVDFELAIGVPLLLTPLSHHHLPPAHIIHGLVLVREKVALDERAIPHRNSITSRFEGSFPPDVGQGVLARRILSVLLVGSCDCTSDTLTADLVGLSPILEASRLDHHSGEELAECVQQIALCFRLLDPVAILRERCLEAVIYCLGQMVVEGIEEFLLRLT